MVARVITVAQQKGGAGKTTLVSHLAVGWTRQRKKVAVVDIDPQGSLTMWYRMREEALGDAKAGLLVNPIKGWRLQTTLDKLKGDHDVVLIDSPPHAETDAKTAIRAADLVVVPVQPSPMDVWATRPTLDLAKAEKRPVLIVLNRVPPRANLTDAMLAKIADYDVDVAKARIGNRVVFAAALAEGRAVGEVAPRSRATAEIKDLAKELWARAG